MSALTFVCWRWQPEPGYRSSYAPETVYALRDMIARHYAKPHRFVCVTDRPQDLTGVDTIPLWSECATLKSPFGRSYPSCYRRLKVFAPDAGQLFGERLVSIDLDVVIVGNLEPLFDRPEDFVIWGESDFPTKQKYCGSLWLLKTGSRPQVWTDFNERTSPQQAWHAGARGSDQAWLSYKLPGEATWGRQDGIYSYRKHIGPHGGQLPKDARVVIFHGKTDPWDYRALQHPWVRQHYPYQVTA